MSSLDAVPREVFILIAALALTYAFWVFVRQWLKGLRMRQRFDRGAEGEREAIDILESNGFVIEGAQVRETYAIEVDGEAIAIAVTADYVVRSAEDGARFVAEVKTGGLATRIEHAATRRQLLEYTHVFDVDGVLLVDADSRTVRCVEFRRAPDRHRRRQLKQSA